MAGWRGAPARRPARPSASSPQAAARAWSWIHLQEVGEQAPQLCAGHHHVDLAAGQLELGALKSRWQVRIGGLLDDARPGETNGRARFRDVDVSEQG